MYTNNHGVTLLRDNYYNVTMIIENNLKFYSNFLDIESLGLNKVEVDNSTYVYKFKSGALLTFGQIVSFSQLPPCLHNPKKFELTPTEILMLSKLIPQQLMRNFINSLYLVLNKHSKLSLIFNQTVQSILFSGIIYSYMKNRSNFNEKNLLEYQDESFEWVHDHFVLKMINEPVKS